MSPQNSSIDPDGDARSQQPSPELLSSLGIKVRDFAYHNTLPAIIPVPRVPRQVQPAPAPPKRLREDSPAPPDRPAAKKPRSLERKPTEPLQDPPLQRPRTLERITLTRVCSIIIPSPRRALPTSSRTRFSASPTMPPMVPPLSHLKSHDPQLVEAPPMFPFVVHVDDTSLISASSESHAAPCPTVYSRLTLESRSALRCSPAPSPLNPPPVLSGPYSELSSPNKELEADPHIRKRRSGAIASTTPTPSRYQLRQRSGPSSPLSRCPRQASGPPTKSLSRRTRRIR